MNLERGYEGPIYLQLARQMELAVASGQYQPGARLPGVREMAEAARVNPNTMQRALVELERRGLVFTQSTSGRFITQDETCILEMREALARTQMREFLQGMSMLGFSGEQALLKLTDMVKGEE